MQPNTALSSCSTKQITETARESPSSQRVQILADAVYLTEEAAEVVRVKPSTIRHAVRCGHIRGRGRPFRILGSELFKLCGGPTP